jgi:hypothetical protein
VTAPFSVSSSAGFAAAFGSIDVLAGGAQPAPAANAAPAVDVACAELAQN